MFDGGGAGARGLQRLAVQPVIREDLAHLVWDLRVFAREKDTIHFSDNMRLAGESGLEPKIT